MWGRLAAMLAVMWSLWALTTGPVQAATARPLDVSFTPAVASLRTGDVATLYLVIRNPNATGVQITNITLSTTPRLTAPDRVPPPRYLAAAGTTAIPVTVSAGDGYTGGTLSALITSKAPGAAGSVSTASVAIAGDMTPAPLRVTLDVPSELRDGDRRAGTVRLTSGAVGFSLVSITAQDGEDVHLRFECGPTLKKCHTRASTLTFADLTPGNNVVIATVVRVNDSVHAGTQNVGVTVSGVPRTSVPVSPIRTEAASTVTLSVFGVDVLSPFGIAALFLLPGLLAVVVFVSLARSAYPHTKSLPDLGDFRDPRSMAFVVPLSALAYVIAWLLFGHDLRHSASTLDVAILFAIGVVSGVLAWAVLAVSYFLRVGRRTFRADDSPGRVLHRMKLRDSALNLPRVNSGTQTFFVLDDRAADTLLGCGAVRYSFLLGATTEQQRGWNDAVTTGDVAALDALVKDTVRLRWGGAGVTLMKRDGLQPAQPARILAEEV